MNNKFPLQPILNDDEHTAALKVIESLINENLSDEEEIHFESLSQLVEEYEKKYHSLNERGVKMGNEFLNNLVGLDIKEAEQKVRAQELEPWTYYKNDIRTLICLPENVVSLDHDDNNVVICAQTQESIDKNYE